MTFTVEDGSGIVGANSYSTVSYADDYHSLRNNTTWSGTTADKQAALVNATDYIENKYGFRFRGEQATTSGLAFPRVEGSAYYDDSTLIEALPENIKKATVEYALLSLSDSLYVSSSDVGVSSYSRSVGSISESVSYGASGYGTYKTHPKADAYLVGLLKTNRTFRE